MNKVDETATTEKVEAPEEPVTETQAPVADASESKTEHADNKPEEAAVVAGDLGQLQDDLKKNRSELSILRSIIVVIAALVLLIPIDVSFLTVKMVLFVALIYGSVFSLKSDWADYSAGKISKKAWVASVISAVIVVLAVTYLLTKVAWMLQNPVTQYVGIGFGAK